MTPKSKKELLTALYKHFPSCSSIPIETTGATQVVYGEGNPESKLMIIGEAPGQKEDELGRPFVGRSGKLLTLTLESLGMDRKDVFITNVVKCRPPNNRTPTPQEIELYKKLMLIPEIRIIRPKVILTAGSIALKALLPDLTGGITKVRGTQQIKGPFTIIPTYHPAYILRNPTALNKFRQDVELALSLIKS